MADIFVASRTHELRVFTGSTEDAREFAAGLVEQLRDQGPVSRNPYVPTPTRWTPERWRETKNESAANFRQGITSYAWYGPAGLEIRIKTTPDAPRRRPTMPDATTDGEVGRLRNRITALEANGSELLAKGEQLAAENERLEKHVTAEYQRELESTHVRAKTAVKRLNDVKAERDALKRGGKELGRIIDTLTDLIKNAYLRGADDPIDAVHMLGNLLAELLESDGGFSADEHIRVHQALQDQRTERDALKAAIEQIEIAFIIKRDGIRQRDPNDHDRGAVQVMEIVEDVFAATLAAPESHGDADA